MGYFVRAKYLDLIRVEIRCPDCKSPPDLVADCDLPSSGCDINNPFDDISIFRSNRIDKTHDLMPVILSIIIFFCFFATVTVFWVV